ncbi:hypothetical protein EJ04DRAFT_595468 [Polyplosphaeria fusca]|uniref:Heterokaryon incompatibility domain-containing protein n=1 Tax=Polyplosphaeria fusca TaxID=682080 RepID=A0A9P4QM34_9PLEO|nr:hypothetical protein EJ04DRAFT_595468 [Polyplosphaeria fusca]
MAYTYGGLKDDEIRLVRLLPGSWNDKIHCEVFKTTLSSKSQYQALSYVWGSRNVKRTVWLNGQKHATTVNLECALRHPRLMYPGLVCWIEALCINQANTLERTHQVQIMAQIYDGSGEVLVYLGDSLGRKSKILVEPPIVVFGENLGDISDSMECIGRFSYRDPEDSTRKDSLLDVYIVFCFIHALWDMHRLKTSPLFSRATPGIELEKYLRQFMHTPWTPWWSRVWVVQEVAIPLRVTVLYGTVSTPWEMFDTAAKRYTDHISSCCSELQSSLSRDLISVLDDFSRSTLSIAGLRNASAQTETTNSTLLLLLRKFWNRKASDPRDKVYALLSLAHSSGQTLEITPDYSKSEVEVFTQATLECIYSSKSLHVFNTELVRKFWKDLPTWVPDWDAPGNYVDNNRFAASALYTACRSEQIDMNKLRELRHWNRFIVKGMYITRVEQVHEVMWGDSVETSRDTLKSWGHMIHINLQKSLRTVWRTLCADVMVSMEKRGTKTQTVFRRAKDDDELKFAAWALHSKRSPTDVVRGDKIMPRDWRDINIRA